MRSWLNGCLTKSPRRGDTETRNTAWEHGSRGAWETKQDMETRGEADSELRIDNSESRSSMLNSQFSIA